MTEKKFISPVYLVKPVPVEKLRSNSYNPNHVAAPEMDLLELSIWKDGFTMPIVCYHDTSDDMYEIVDGFHRYTTLKQSHRIYDREEGNAPITVIDKPLAERIASTIRHNRARGVHGIDEMTSIVRLLIEEGHMSDAQIMKEIGMDRDEVLRQKQLSGLASLFEDKEFSHAWEPDE